jgi:beta-glucan synthesis-associated protein KRE6
LNVFSSILQYQAEQHRDAGVYGASRFSSAPPSDHTLTTNAQHEKPLVQQTTNTVPTFMWDKDPDLDDALHNPDPRGRDSSSFTLFSARGWFNAGALVVLVLGLIILFAGYPAIYYYTHLGPDIKGFNLGGINGSGQVPDFPGMRSLIDSDTPSSAYTRTGSDGKKYNLVFSDEFNRDGRTFYPGEDPYWEAADLHYW